VYVIPSLPKVKGWLKSEFAVANKTQLPSDKLCYQVSLCKNFQHQSYSKIIPLIKMVDRFSRKMQRFNLTFSLNLKVVHLLQKALTSRGFHL